MNKLAIKRLERSVEALARMTVNQLREKYREVFGEPTNAGHKDFLAKRLAWRIQSLAEGGLSERAKARAAELARDADLRTTVPRMPKPTAGTTTVRAKVVRGQSADATPLPGTLLTRAYKGRLVQVKVLADGYEHDGQTYRSLSAIARKVTGTQWNGLLFFGLKKDPR